jgi:cobalt-zinc-cadmium efflux system membrane fusion protein
MTARSLFVVAILLAGCSSREAPTAPAPAASAAPAAASANAGPRIVEMSEAAQKEARLFLETVEVRSLPVTVRATGRLTTNENTTWRVGSITDGRVISVSARPGDQVIKGQILARMHSHDIHESRAEYRRAHSERTRAQSNLDFTRRQRDRLRRLFEMKAASQEQVEQADNEVRNAEAVLKNAENELGRTRLHLTEFLQIPIEGPEEHGHSADPEVHEEDLIPVRAPETGIVLTRLITPGAVVTASSDLFVICNLSTIWAMAAVQEEHLSRLRVGMPAQVTVQAYERTFPGRVGKIDEKLDPQTRTVQVRVEIDNRQSLLKPEMYSTVELEAGGSEPALLVQPESVQDVNGQATVFVHLGGTRFEARAVETGRQVGPRVQVMRGLRGGDRIVAEGSFVLKSQLLRASMSGEE